MRHRWIILILVALMLISISFFIGVVFYAVFDGGHVFGSSIGVVDIDGPIILSDKTVDQLEEFRKDDNVKAVVIRIDSPGGAAAASQEIFNEVRLLSKEKPVVASMGNIATSGAYYIACGARKIFANSSTTTGSIGVRLEHMILGGLMDWAKVKQETLKSGKLKDLIPINRPIDPEARRLLQGVLDDIHEQFKIDVSRSRDIPMDRLAKFADGRVFTGKKALLLGLIDKIGGFVPALKEAARMAGIHGEPNIVRPRKHRGFLHRFLSEMKSDVLSSVSQPMYIFNR